MNTLMSVLIGVVAGIGFLYAAGKVLTRWDYYGKSIERINNTLWPKDENSAHLYHPNERYLTKRVEYLEDVVKDYDEVMGKWMHHGYSNHESPMDIVDDLNSKIRALEEKVHVLELNNRSLSDLAHITYTAVKKRDEEKNE